MDKNSQSVPGNTAEDQNKNASGQYPTWHRLIKSAFQANRRFLIVGGIILVLFTFLLSVLQFLLIEIKPEDHTSWKILLSLVLNVNASLLAACLVSILAAFLLFNETAEHKRQIETAQYIENAANSVAKKIPPPIVRIGVTPFTKAVDDLSSEVQQWRKRITCNFDDMCPPELRNLRRELTMMSQDAPLEGVSSIALPLLHARLCILSSQIKELHEGKWRLHYYEDDEVKNIQTETDLFYALITDHLFTSLKDVSLQASTVIHYLDWWLTLPGLSYLEAEKHRRLVKRLFLFPVGTIGTIFEDYISESKILEHAVSKEKSNGWNGKSVFDEQYPKLSKEQALVVLLLNYNVTENIKLLTPAFCDEDMQKRHAIDWLTKDEVIFQRENSSRVTPLCCAEVTSFDGSHDILRAVKSYLYFSPHEVEQRAKIWSDLADVSDTYMLSMSSIVEESEKLSALNEDVKPIVAKSPLPKARNQIVNLWKKMKKGNNNG